MEKQSFLLYLGVGFLITVAVWGLMGGGASKETQVAKVEQPISQQKLAVPKVESESIKPEEVAYKETLPVVPETVVGKVVPDAPKKEIQKVVKKVKKVKMVEEVKEVTHTVAKGETLWGISRQYKTTVESVMELNQLDGMSVGVNQKLKIKGKVQVPHEYFVEEAVEEVVEVAPTQVEEVVVAQPVVQESAPPVALAAIKESLPEKPVLPLSQETPPPQPKGPSFESFTGELLTHEVASQDSLITIASKYQTTVAFLKDINGLTEKSQLQEGQILLVPGK